MAAPQTNGRTNGTGQERNSGSTNNMHVAKNNPIISIAKKNILTARVSLFPSASCACILKGCH
jgi:hypothetical protein